MFDQMHVGHFLNASGFLWYPRLQQLPYFLQFLPQQINFQPIIPFHRYISPFPCCLARYYVIP